jgi:hypothetical protein
MMVEAIGLASTSASSWLANTTATFFLRSVFSQSWIWRRSASFKEEPCFIEDEQGRAPSKRRSSA